MIGCGTPSAAARLRVIGAITRRLGRRRSPRLAGSNRRDITGAFAVVASSAYVVMICSLLRVFADRDDCALRRFGGADGRLTRVTRRASGPCASG
ncbi:hypothetical protein GCM10018965_098220 [Nonomuraea roseola]